MGFWGFGVLGLDGNGDAKRLGWDGIGLGGISCTWPRKDGVGFWIEIHRRWVGWDNTLEKNL